jgi:LmbE family N-acetylglucosaminyl deacetylase
LTVVLSPHCDDAVLSTFGAILDGASVVTIFAGEPWAEATLEAWDRCCGFADPSAAMRARWVEDDAALTGVEHSRLDLLEEPYRPDLPRAAITDRLVELLAPLLAGETIVYAPVSVAPRPHPDHLLTLEAAWALRESYDELRLYGCMPHILRGEGVWPAAIKRGVTSAPAYWWRCLDERPITSRWPKLRCLTRPEAEAKAERTRLYRSQFRGLTTALRMPARSVLKNPSAYSIEAWWPGKRARGSPVAIPSRPPSSPS